MRDKWLGEAYENPDKGTQIGRGASHDSFGTGSDNQNSPRSRVHQPTCGTLSPLSDAGTSLIQDEALELLRRSDHLHDSQVRHVRVVPGRLLRPYQVSARRGADCTPYLVVLVEHRIQTQ